MDLSFSSNVFVLNQASYGNPKADAIKVNLTFFVRDNSSIQNITIGTSKRINGTSTMDPNNNSNSSVVTFQQADFAWMNDVPGPPGNGYYVRYLIGEIPFSGGPSVTGNYNGTQITDFNLDAAWCYIKVPFTINFSTVPEQGFILYVYANNSIQGQDKAHTAWSHDGAFYQGEIPEFSTIAIPIAAVLGLLFFFNHRKRREE